MKFQMKGQKENLLKLAKEGRGVEFKGILLHLQKDNSFSLI